MIRRILQLAVFSGLLAAGLHAAPLCTGTGAWNEGDDGQGDAGSLPKSANNTIGTGSLNEICGDLSNATDGVDMYAIDITGSTFTADTTADALEDPNLYLFDSTGQALDAAFDNSGTADLDLSGLTPGLYYLAIAPTGQYPENKNGDEIFDPPTTTPVVTPTIVKSWTDDGDDSGKYLITLTDASFANLPEPGTLALIGAGLGLVGMAKRQR